MPFIDHPVSLPPDPAAAEGGCAGGCAVDVVVADTDGGCAEDDVVVINEDMLRFGASAFVNELRRAVVTAAAGCSGAAAAPNAERDIVGAALAAPPESARTRCC